MFWEEMHWLDPTCIQNSWGMIMKRDWEQSSDTMIIVNYDLAPLHDQADFSECQYLHPAIVGTAMGKLPRRATLFCISSPDCDVKIGRLLWIAPWKLGPVKVKQDSLSENVPFKGLNSMYSNSEKRLCAIYWTIILCVLSINRPMINIWRNIAEPLTQIKRCTSPIHHSDVLFCTLLTTSFSLSIDAFNMGLSYNIKTHPRKY